MQRSTLMIGASGTLLVLVAVALAQEAPPPTQPRNQPAGSSAEPATAAYPVPPPQSLRVYTSPAGVLQVQIPHTEPKISELVHKWEAAEGDEARDQAKGELRAALKDEFEARLKAHEQQIEELESQVKRLREQLDQRREKQDDIIDFRLEQVLRDAQGLGWGTDGFAQPPGGLPGLSTVPSARNFNPLATPRTTR